MRFVDKSVVSVIRAFICGVLCCIVGVQAEAEVPESFMKEVRKLQKKEYTARNRKTVRKWLSDGGATFLYALSYAKSVNYYNVPEMRLKDEVKNYSFSNNLLDYLDASPENFPGCAVIYGENKNFIGYIDCTSKSIGYLSYCPCDTTTEYLLDAKKKWQMLKEQRPEFVFTVRGFRNCIFFLKEGKAYVSVLGNYQVHDMQYFLTHFCNESSLRLGYHRFGDAFLY